jgi:hypothetical protein
LNDPNTTKKPAVKLYSKTQHLDLYTAESNIRNAENMELIKEIMSKNDKIAT